MMKQMLHTGILGRILMGALMALALVSPHGVSAQTAVTARDAWMREPLPSRDVTAVFVTLENTGSEKRSIVSATSAIAGKVELHHMVMANGMMRMTPVQAIELAPGKTELKPGSFHIMVFDLKERPAPGAKVDFTLTLDNGQTIPISAEVRKVEGIKD